MSETGSTNADLVEAAVAGAPDATVLRADHQTAGRGRLDRRWEAPPGANLLVSILLRTAVHPSLGPHDLVRAVSLAAVEACATTAGVRPGLKWPNDLLLGGEKLSGVLAQSGTSDDGDFTVVGIGINIGWAPDGATSLSSHCDHPPTPAALCEEMLRALEELLPLSRDGIHRRYVASLVTLGERVRASTPNGDIVGRALDVDVDGRLEVLDDCAITHRIDTADVVHLRPDRP